jgi:hypothetical protein
VRKSHIKWIERKTKAGMIQDNGGHKLDYYKASDWSYINEEVKWISYILSRNKKWFIWTSDASFNVHRMGRNAGTT